MDGVVSAAENWVPTPMLLALIAALLTAVFALLRMIAQRLLVEFAQLQKQIADLSRHFDTQVHELKLAQTKFVTFDDLSRSLNSLHEKANDTRERLAVLEATRGN